METEWDGALPAAEYLRKDAEGVYRGSAYAHAALLSDIAVSVGVGVRVAGSLEGACRARGWPILRRTTGGTGLLHRPGDLLWSVVLPRTDPRAGRGFVRGYGRLGAPIVTALAEAGAETSWAPPLGLSDRFCLFGPRGEVLTHRGRALGGAAQHLTANALLHHGTVGDEVDPDALGELFRVPAALLQAHLTSVRRVAPGASLERIGRRCLAIWGLEGPP